MSLRDAYWAEAGANETCWRREEEGKGLAITHQRMLGLELLIASASSISHK